MNSDPWTLDVADRLRRLPPYLFGTINALRHQKRQAGIDMIDLGMGNPMDGAPHEVVDKLCEAAKDPRNHRYSASAGIYNLRKDLSDLYDRIYNVSLDPEKEVIATIGSKEGFSHLCLAMMGPGDTAIVGDPYFPIHVYAVALAGGNVVNVPLGNDQEFLNNIQHAVENQHPRPKLLILNYPHNPTAMTVDDTSFFEAVVDLAKRFNFYVIHDFAYWRNCYDGYKAPSFMQVKGAKDVGVEFVTFSKPYNMAGFRIGFCVGNPEMVRALGTIKGYYDYGMFQAIQIASIIAMREGEPFIVEQNDRYRLRRNIVRDGLERIGWDVSPCRAGMFVWAKIAEEHLAGQGSIDFSLRLMEEAEVCISPGRAFGENGEGYARIALVENEQRIRQAIRNMDGALNKGVFAPSASKLGK
jgi:alanine-synthesizing transaminase